MRPPESLWSRLPPKPTHSASLGVLLAVFRNANRCSFTYGRSLILATFLASLGCHGVQPGPETRRQPVTDVVHGESIVDDYRWLEQSGSDEVHDWIERQNAYSEAVLEEVEDLRRHFRSRLTELMDTASVGPAMAAGESQIFTLRRRGEPVARVVRRVSPGEDAPRRPIDPTARYEVIIDPLELRADGTTSVQPLAVSPDGRVLLYSVRDGGPDEIELRLRDLETGSDLPDRFPVALYSSTFVFDTESQGFLYVHRSRSEGSRVRYHRLGSAQSEDPIWFGDDVGPTQFLQVRRSPDNRTLLYGTQHGWRRNELFLQSVDEDGVTPSGPVRPLVEGLDARFEPHYIGGELLLLTNLDAPRNRVVRVDLSQPPEKWRDLIPESDETLLSFGDLHGKLYARYARDASVRLRLFEVDWQTRDAPLDVEAAREIELEDILSASIEPAEQGFARLSVQSFLEPRKSWTLDLESGQRELWKDTDVSFDGSSFESRRIWVTSKDGTRLPVFVTHRKGLEKNSNTPALLYGYGGFNSALLPSFDPLAVAWLEAGGVYAVAILRGGGEFGEDWHRAGMLANKQNVFDDFIAAAEGLIEEGLTSSEHLAIRGVSNGGLLVGSVMTQRPELMRAVYCGFPDLDMVRFVTFEQTNNKPALLEYGDASLADEFQFLRRYSPYQRVEKGVPYPAVMFATGELDTRVPPLQARKMAALLQAATSSGRPVVLRDDPRAGHAGGRTIETAIDDRAAELAFLWWQVAGDSLGS